MPVATYPDKTGILNHCLSYINPHLENIPEARYHVTGRYDIS